MSLRIVRDAIELDGDDGGVTIAEIRRVAAAFEVLFARAPEIRITGSFDAGACRLVGGVEGGPPLNLLGTSLFYPVLLVGDRWLDVQLERGVNGGRAVGLDPALGRRVRLRFRPAP